MEIKNPRTGVKLYCDIKGQGDPTVIIINGWTANHRRTEKLEDMLSQRYRVVSYDQRGHGLSDKRRDLDFGFGSFVLDLVGVMDDLKIEQPVIAGHSMGGMVALHMARAFPERVRGLVLLGAAAHLVRDERERGSMLRAAWMCRHAYWLVTKIKDAEKRKRPEIFTDIEDPRFMPSPEAIGLSLMAMANYDIRDQLEFIETPSLAIATPPDDTVSFECTEEMARLLPNCELVSLPDCTHHFITEEPQKTFDAMLGFLEQFS